MSKHTPSPWTIEYGYLVVGGTDPATVLVADTSPRARSPLTLEECIANAAIIVAAPEMLQALRDIAYAIKDSRYRECFEREMDLAFATIAKAEGR